MKAGVTSPIGLVEISQQQAGARRLIAYYPSGLETTVSIILREGQECHHFRVDSARLRWTDACHAGWEITATDKLTRTRLTNFLELCERGALPPESWRSPTSIFPVVQPIHSDKIHSELIDCLARWTACIYT